MACAYVIPAMLQHISASCISTIMQSVKFKDMNRIQHMYLVVKINISVKVSLILITNVFLVWVTSSTRNGIINMSTKLFQLLNGSKHYASPEMSGNCFQNQVFQNCTLIC